MNYGPLFVFIAAILWGLDGVLRRTLFNLPPITIVFYEHLIGAILIAPFLWRAWRAESLRTITGREWSALGVVALFSGVLGTLLFTAALLQVNFIPFSVVFLVQKLQPIFAILMAWVVLRERPTGRYALWAALAILAGYFVTFPNGVINTGEGGAYITAAAFAFFAAVCWGSSTALSRYVLLGHSNTFITGLRFFLTVPIALLFVAFLGATPSLSNITSVQLLTLGAIALSTGMIALWVYYKGLQSTPVRVAAIVELAFPMTAVLIDYFLYGTTLAPSQYFAAAVLLFAMYRVSLLQK
ncbi:MAG: DMT family transporter [Candidatus Kaiserbacteria bacterium]|nr:MAG: DMT family transporter [Candidatus Kaiserbacteria bacterium]